MIYWKLLLRQTQVFKNLPIETVSLKEFPWFNEVGSWPHQNYANNKFFGWHCYKFLKVSETKNTSRIWVFTKSPFVRGNKKRESIWGFVEDCFGKVAGMTGITCCQRRMQRRSDNRNRMDTNMDRLEQAGTGHAGATHLLCVTRPLIAEIAMEVEAGR